MIGACVVAYCTRSTSWTSTAHSSPVKSTSGAIRDTVHTLRWMINSSCDVLSICLELLDIMYRVCLFTLLLLFAIEIGTTRVFSNVYFLLHSFYRVSLILLLALTTDVSSSSWSSLRLGFDFGRLLNRAFAIQLPLSLPSLTSILALFVNWIGFFGIYISVFSSPGLLIRLSLHSAPPIWFSLDWGLLYSRS